MSFSASAVSLSLGTPKFPGPLSEQARTLLRTYSHAMFSPRVDDSGFGEQDLTTNMTVDFNRKVAQGGYADVYKGILKTGRTRIGVAVKEHRHALGDMTTTLGKLQNELQTEISLWSSFVHPNILQLLGVYFRYGPTHLPCFVSPWCNNGTITEYITAARQRAAAQIGISEPVDNNFPLLCLEVELATAGLVYLHNRNVVHGDIKACNILVHEGIARLSDFGYSVAVIERSGTTSSRLGTFRWYAPESLGSGARRTREADMWAMGCVILEVQTLKLPYCTLNDQAIPTARDGGQLPYDPPEDMNAELRTIAEACWTFLPSERPTSRRTNARLRALLESLLRVRKAFLLYGINEISRSSNGAESALKSLLSSLLIMSAQDPLPDPSAMQAVFTKIANALGELEALGNRYSAARLRPLVREIANRHSYEAKDLMTRLASAELRSPLRGHTASVVSVAFLSDGRRLVCCSGVTVRIWDIETGKTVLGPFEGHKNTVRRVATHGERIASCSYDGTFCVWHARTGKLVLGPITAHRGKFTEAIAFSKSGTHIASGGHDNRVAIWDARTGFELREMAGHEAPVLCIAFSPDGKRLASGSQDRTVRIWDVASGKCIGMPLTGHSGWVTSVCFAPDDRRLFSSSGDTTIRCWNLETRQRVFNPLRAGDQVLCTALSPDGKRLASGSESGKIILWNAENGERIPTPFRNHRGDVWGVAFSPHGRKLASASKDETIALWDVAGDWKDYDLYDTDEEESMAELPRQAERKSRLRKRPS